MTSFLDYVILLQKTKQVINDRSGTEGEQITMLDKFSWQQWNRPRLGQYLGIRQPVYVPVVIEIPLRFVKPAPTVLYLLQLSLTGSQLNHLSIP